jgi:dihydrofolate reductase
VSHVADITTAIEAAKQAAGTENVMMHGVTATRLAFEAGLLDELEIHLVPVLLGGGTRLFDGLPPEHIELDRTRVLEGDAGMVHPTTAYCIAGSGRELPSGNVAGACDDRREARGRARGRGGRKDAR